MLSPAKKLLLIFAITLTNAITQCVFADNTQAEKTYSPKERQNEEARIRAKIEERLDWKNRTPEKLDEVADSDRLLRADLNESTLLRQATGERFGVFESFDDKTNTKVFEVLLHKKNKLTDRFFLFGSECKSASIAAKKVTATHALYLADCYSEKNPTYYSLYLFDYASRNFYLLGVLDYYPDNIQSSTIKLEDGVYKLRWNIHLRGANKNTLLIRNFKILKNNRGMWQVKELPPIDNNSREIFPLEKLPLKPEYNLPSFVADWGK